MYCMRLIEPSVQVDSTTVGKQHGTFADFFANITRYDGVLVQGRMAQEGEDIPAAGQTLMNESLAMRICTLHPLFGLSS